MSEKPILTGFSFSDVHNGFSMLEKPYKLRSNVDTMIDNLLGTVGKVDIVLNGGDYISDYPSWLNPGHLPYQYYLEYKALTVKTFARLAKDGKVFYVAGNHDYAQGEASTDGNGRGGSYNSFEYYYTGPMNETFGLLSDNDKCEAVSSHDGLTYLLAWHYVVNGIDFFGLAPDRDMIWDNQGCGFNERSLKWLEKRIDEVDPNGNKPIFVVCHYAISQRVDIQDVNDPVIDYGVKNLLEPSFIGHKNLFFMFGHWHTIHSYPKNYSVLGVMHFDKDGKLIKIKGDETDSKKVVNDPSKLGYTCVWMGGGRVDFDGHAERFHDDFFWGDGKGFGGFDNKETLAKVIAITGTPKFSQGMYFEVYDDRVVFTMKNCGEGWEGYETKDLLKPYTFYFAK